MILSQSLGYLSLLAFLALWGRAVWKTYTMSRNSWHFGNHNVDKLPEVLACALKRCLDGGFVIVGVERGPLG